MTVEFFIFMENMGERGEFEFQWESLGSMLRRTFQL